MNILALTVFPEFWIKNFILFLQGHRSGNIKLMDKNKIRVSTEVLPTNGLSVGCFGFKNTLQVQ